MAGPLMSAPPCCWAVVITLGLSQRVQAAGLIGLEVRH